MQSYIYCNILDYQNHHTLILQLLLIRELYKQVDSSWAGCLLQTKAAKLICRQEVEFPSPLSPDYKEKSAYLLMLPDVPTEKGIKLLIRIKNKNKKDKNKTVWNPIAQIMCQYRVYVNDTRNSRTFHFKHVVTFYILHNYVIKCVYAMLYTAGGYFY